MRNWTLVTKGSLNSKATPRKTTASACNPQTQININHGPDAFKAYPALHFLNESKHEYANRIRVSVYRRAIQGPDGITTPGHRSCDGISHWRHNHRPFQ